MKEFEGDARTIISNLHHYHTESNVAQHEVKKNSGDITDANKQQESFNFAPHAPKLKILTIVKKSTTTDAEKLEIKRENNQYKMEYETELQLHLKQKNHYHMNLGKA